ncbi:hypothetical protein Tco_0173631, partial [Tanacetum coccineum]
MNPNADDEYENLSDADDETDLWFMTKPIECHQLMQQECQGSTSRSLIYRDGDDTEKRLMRNYFGDYPKYLEYALDVVVVTDEVCIHHSDGFSFVLPE